MKDVLDTMDRLWREGHTAKEDLSEIEEEVDKVIQVPLAIYYANEIPENPEHVIYNILPD